MANNQVSAQARGIVVILQGKAWVVNAEGVRKALQVGDEVQEGQTVITEDGARLELALPNGQPLVVASGRELLIEGNLLGTDPTDNTDAAIADLNSGAAQIARTLAGTGDLSLELDPTAAGLAGGQTSEAHSFVRILRIEENLSPLSLDRAGEQGDNNQIFLNGSEQAATGNITDTTPSIAITDMNGAAAGLVTVNESALPTGTNPTSTAESVDGTIVISAAKGLDSIDFGATTVTLAQLNGLGAAPVTIASPDGTITLTDYNPVTGTISYTYTIAAAQTGPNAASTSVADTLTVTVRDAGGFTAAAIFTATILDDAPIARDDTNSITEDALPDTISGNVFTNDSIGADTLSNPIAATAGTINLLYGTLNLTSAGNYVYTLNNANATVNALTPGMSLVDTYTYTLTDKDGDSTTATLRITINGTNDAPVITNAAAALLGTVVEAGNLDDGTAVTGTTSATGTLSASDVDSGATQTWTLQGTPSTTYGSMALVGSKWTYTIDNSLATTQALKEGQSVTQTYTVRVTDDFGAYKDQTVTITINGTNDAPVITNAAAALLGTVVEAGNLDDGTAVTGTTSATGTLSASDVDSGATQTWTLQGTPSTTYGSMALVGSKWTYTIDNSLATTQALKEGQSVTQTYTVRVTDDFGAYKDQTVTITINGTNDAPVITNAAAALLGTVVEAGNLDDGTAVTGTTSATGTLSASDVDSGATQTWTLQGTPSTTYGSMALVGSKWTYTIDNSLATTQALKEGQSVTQTYTVRVTDDFGAYKDQTVTITINGTNDAPVITNAAAALLGTVVEAGNLDDGTAVTGTTSATGTLSASDVDSGATQTWTLQGTPSTTYGSMALVGSKWTYTIDNSLATTQALKEGQSVTQTYTVRVTDDFGAYKDQTVTITINGTNDKPVAIGSNATGLEDAASIPVILQGTDVDGTVASFNLSSLPTNGALYLDAALTILVTTGTDIAATGNSLTLYFKPAADFNSGSLSGSITPSFNFTATDNNGAVSNVATDTITVTAVSDGAPTAVNDGFKTLAGTPITFTRAQLLANDSLLDHATISSTGALPTGLTYNSATQTYTYAPLTAGSGSFTYTITDDDGQTSTATVSLNAYSSTTDLATVYESALSTGSGTGVSTVTGNLFTNDAGLTGNITSISGGTSTLSGNTYTVTTSYGTLVVDRTTGAYTYTLSAAVDNDSATGATTTELLQTFTYARTGGSANLLVTIIDDVPSAQNHIIEIPQASALTNYNLVLMLDVSGSMTATNSGGAVRLVDANGNVTISTRLEASKQAMIDMVTKYFNESASVSVKVGYFSASATAGTTSLTTLSSVIAAINAIPASGGNTNYEDALYKIQDMFGVVDTSKTNVTYFISDGVPTVQVGSGSGTTSPATETNGTSNPVSYAQFLANNPSVLSYSIGIGGGISNTAPLDSIHNVDADASNVKDPAILVNDLNQLSTALTSTIPSTFGGNIGTNGRNPFVNIGADGGFVQHIDLLLDSNDADTAPDSIVRFTFNGSNQITYDNFFLTGTHTTVTVTGTMLTLNSALGFTKGLAGVQFRNRRLLVLLTGCRHQWRSIRHRLHRSRQ